MHAWLVPLLGGIALSWRLTALSSFIPSPHSSLRFRSAVRFRRTSSIVKGCFAAVLSLILAPSLARAQLFTLSSITGAWDYDAAYIRQVDPATGSTISIQGIRLQPGFTYGAYITGLAAHPTTGEFFLLVESAPVPRGPTDPWCHHLLAKLDPATGATTIIGNTGICFASLAFHSNGTLYGVSNSEGAVPPALFTLDTTNATPTLLISFGPVGVSSGAVVDGSGLAFNPSDGLLYRSGRVGVSDQVFQAVNPNTLAVTNIPLSGSPTDEIITLTHAFGNTLLGADVGNRLISITTGGVRTVIGPMDHLARGMVELEAQDLGPGISITDVTVTEGNSGIVTATFQVNLSAPSTQPVTVTFITANGTANAGTDYVGTSGTITFDPGGTTKTITVVVEGNNTLELDKTFVVNLTSATTGFIADGHGVGTIVNDDGPLPQMLANISSRGGVLTGNNVMIGGFIIDGTAPKRVLVRSRGPSMAGAPFFVPGTLANPMVQLFSGPTMIAQNDNWQDAPNCPGFVCEGATEILNTGLDPCTPNPGQSLSPLNCALEAAILITLPPGAYTAIVNGVAGGTGVGLVEVFEADATTVSDLSNISTRGFVQSGDDVMIGGLIIEGSSPATVLIRARGPSMSGVPFFVPGTLANPFLQLFSGQDVIAQNDNWQDAPSCSGFVCGTAAQIAATGLDPCQPNPGESTPPVACAQESAILITLPPGAYTAIVSGVGDGTGVGLVEAFEMD
jgi:Calx-beta domain-containing protein